MAADSLIGTRWICRHAGSSLLREGKTYTIQDTMEFGIDDVPLVEMKELWGFLYRLSRFERAPCGAGETKDP